MHYGCAEEDNLVGATGPLRGGLLSEACSKLGVSPSSGVSSRFPRSSGMGQAASPTEVSMSFGGSAPRDSKIGARVGSSGARHS